MGSDRIEALDNERSRHRCYFDKYAIDRYPVTCSQYRNFMASDGYQNPQWWSADGWTWLQAPKVDRPLYWSDNPAFDNHPVCGVSWYKAQAYCNFIGKRLPTESEWEKAASCDAASQSQRIYPWGEEPPNLSLCNHGYSQAYFDGKHRVLKGGSWATPSQTLRSSFRNWYDPGVRQIIAGFRCAQ